MRLNKTKALVLAGWLLSWRLICCNTTPMPDDFSEVVAVEAELAGAEDSHSILSCISSSLPEGKNSTPNSLFFTVGF